MPPSVTVSGRGLHSGRPATVTLSSGSDGVVLRTESGSALLSTCEVRGTYRGVCLAASNGDFEVDGVEHLLSALGAWSVRRGLDIHVTGGEIPLADGAAAEFAEAVAKLNPPRDPPPLVVARSGTVELGESIYAFEPGGGTTLDVEVEFGAAAIGTERARWNGSFETFVADIARARTFGFRRDENDLIRQNRARGVDPRVVMVLGDDGRVEPPGAPAGQTEFARHKLLDLVGDLYLFGGPPRGAVFARRPGHGATHRAVAIGLERGLLITEGSAEIRRP